MSFTVFRKYEKPLLVVACVFTVLVFAFFPSMGSMSDVLGDDPESSVAVLGEFTVETSGETRQVSRGEFTATSQKLNRLFRNADMTENDVWAHIIETADALGAGVHVSDKDLLEMLTQMRGEPISSQDEYRFIVTRVLGFPSLDTFEGFMREVVARERWREVKLKASTVVPASEVYQRWRVDNERFDYEALVFADLEPEQIADPGDELLREHYDGLPEWQRNSAFVDPAKADIAYGWLPLDALAEVPAEIVETVEVPSDAEVDLRFQRVKAQRFTDLEELDADTRELLRDELRVIALVRRAHQELAALKASEEAAAAAAAVAAAEEGAEDAEPVEPAGLDTETFLATLAAQGLRTVDPEGLLDPDALTDLDDIGTRTLSAYLRNAQAGDVHYVEPFTVDTQTHVVFVQEKVDQRSLDFDEGREQVLEHWRAAQVSQPARDARESLSAQARELPEVLEIVEPLEAQAQTAADERIATAEAAIDIGLEPLSDDARQAIRDEEQAAIQPAVDARLAEFEHLAWDAVAAAGEAAGATRSGFEAVPKSYRNDPDPDEDATGLERFLKTNTAIFQQAVDGVTTVLRHPASNSSVIVRISARNFPEMPEMLADSEGLLTARRAQATAARFSFMQEASADSIVASHGLNLTVFAPPEGEDGAADDGAPADGQGS